MTINCDKKTFVLIHGGIVKKLLIMLTLFSCIVDAQVYDFLEIYRLAQENDALLKEAYYSKMAVEESDDQSLARLLPNVSFVSGVSKNFLNNSRRTYQGTGYQDYWNESFGLNLNQSVFHYDQWVQLSQSDNKIVQAAAYYEAERQKLMLRVADAYFRILAAQDNYRFTQAEQQAISRQLEQAKHKYKVGVSAITDIHEAQAIFDQSVADGIAAEAQIANEKQRLLEIIGDIDVDIKTLGSTPAFVGPNPEILKKWEEMADSNNLMIIALTNQVEVSRKAIEIQWSGHLPQVDLIASYSQQYTNSSFGLQGDTEAVGLQLNVPLYAGGGTSSKVRQSTAEFEADKEKLLGQRRTVHRDVNDAYRGVISSISKAKALHTAVESSKKALEATEEGMSVGTRTIVEVLIEQRNLYRANRDYAQSIYDYIINRIKLKHAVSDITQQDLEQINYLLLAPVHLEESANNQRTTTATEKDKLVKDYPKKPESSTRPLSNTNSQARDNIKIPPPTLPVVGQSSAPVNNTNPQSTNNLKIPVPTYPVPVQSSRKSSASNIPKVDYSHIKMQLPSSVASVTPQVSKQSLVPVKNNQTKINNIKTPSGRIYPVKPYVSDDSSAPVNNKLISQH